MYSRNYGRGDISAKITPPPAYSGSAIQSGEIGGTDVAAKDAGETQGAFAPFSQSIPLQKPAEEEKERPVCPPPKEEAHRPPPASGKPESGKSSLLSGIFADFSTEDLILIGIIVALAFDLADRDILLVALVVAVVLM
ncbi:MAG: hypothetical protein IJX55_06675 [Clostridia bacterium]|nr:hypothetical protein [Clostridia bacterium]